MKAARAHFALLLGLAPALATPPVAAQVVAAPEMVACVSPDSLWNILDAKDVNDVEALRQLQRECRVLRNATYSLVATHNGTAKILVFRKAGDWESAETLYTLDEMLGSDRGDKLALKPLS
jgi:hypothetical protein